MDRESGPNKPTDKSNAGEDISQFENPGGPSNVIEHPTAHDKAIVDPAVAEQVARLVVDKEEAVLAAKAKVEAASNNLDKKASFFALSRETRLDDAESDLITARLDADASTNSAEYDINHSQGLEK